MFLYIDPGTGSMLFSILIGGISTLVFIGRKIFLKLKFVLSGGQSEFELSNLGVICHSFQYHSQSSFCFL